jgi:hypothetical protein
VKNFVHTAYSEFTPLDEEAIPSALTHTLKNLPFWRGILRYVDYDGTLLDDTRRFDIDPNLEKEENRGDGAYIYIPKEYSTTMHIDTPSGEVSYDDQEAYDNFIQLLDPKNHLFHNTGEFFDPNNPQHFILSAWHKYYQEKKIDASWFWPNVQKIIVPKAWDKILAMLVQVAELGYIPQSIEFYDDRVDFGVFSEAANFISKALRGIPVRFFHMKKCDQNERRVNMKLHQVSKWVTKIIENL